MSEEKTVTIGLTKAELWELMNGFSQSFNDDESNGLARLVSDKLAAAYKKVIK